MKKAIIATLEVVAGVMFWLIMLTCGFAGYRYSLNSGTGFPGIAAIGLGLLGGWVIAVLTTGFVYMLLSINDHLSVIRGSVETDRLRPSPPTE